jgi:hypothetical protein
MAVASRDNPSYFGLTWAAAILAFVFYPMTLAPVGSFTNGGALGLISILLALCLAWLALGLNTANSRLWMALQIPITALITYLAISESAIQFMLGPERWLWR